MSRRGLERAIWATISLGLVSWIWVLKLELRDERANECITADHEAYQSLKFLRSENANLRKAVSKYMNECGGGFIDANRRSQPSQR